MSFWGCYAELVQPSYIVLGHFKLMTSTGYVQPFRAALASDWRSAYGRDEWFFTRLVNETVKPLSSIEAFAAIDEVVQLLPQQPEMMYECGVLLLNLARHSDTTEMPCGLRGAWDTVMRLLRDYSDIAEQLRDWYRQP
jgi:hypothetical protein